MFFQNANIMYIMMGEPIVKNEMYINHMRILVEAIPSLTPMEEHTPKACNSKNSLIFCMNADFFKQLKLSTKLS